MSRTLLVGALATLLLASPAMADGASNLLTDPRAHAGELANQRDTDQYVGTRGPRAATFLVGDSTGRIGLWGGLAPQGLGRGWEASTVPGRDVSTLPYYLRDRVASQQPYVVTKKVKRHGKHRRGHRYRWVRRAALRYPVRTVVVALGTNGTPGWQYADLRRAIDLLPSTTKVVLVTPYRTPSLWPDSQPFRSRASVAAAYARWERRIAELRPHTCVADWAAFVQRYPQAVHDGVHQTSDGALAWGRLVAGTVSACR